MNLKYFGHIRLNKMKVEIIKAIATTKEVKEIDLFVKFFNKRFPNELNEIKSYVSEWCDRFNRGNPQNYMDSKSLIIYNGLRNERNQMDKIKLIEKLKSYHHDFLNRLGCEHFLNPFDIKIELSKEVANPEDIKGLSLWDKKGNSIKEAEGLSGLEISDLIAFKLKVKTQNYFGRGTQHRANCEAIIKKLNIV